MVGEAVKMYRTTVQCGATDRGGSPSVYASPLSPTDIPIQSVHRLSINFHIKFELLEA